LKLESSQNRLAKQELASAEATIKTNIGKYKQKLAITTKRHTNSETHQVFVQSKESILAWTVEQISKACESIVYMHV